tara:strand:- start:23536 stop:23940 length:405 start_codon:yes stop_codon:yes gene_type:complete
MSKIAGRNFSSLKLNIPKARRPLMNRLEDMQLDENRLLQMEYLVDQSRMGHHLLFDNATVSRVFTEENENDEAMFKVENLARIQDLLAEFMDKSTLKEKRRFLDTLEDEDHDLLVRTYFNIIENSIHSVTPFKH